jgi:hypothetical protein
MHVLQYLGDRDSVSNGEEGFKIQLSFHQENYSFVYGSGSPWYIYFMASHLIFRSDGLTI